MNKNQFYESLFYTYLQGCKVKSAGRFRSCLKLFFRYLEGRDVRDVTDGDIIGFVQYLSKTKSQYGRVFKKTSIASYLSSLKSFFNYLYQNDLVLRPLMENMELKQGPVKVLRKVFSVAEMGRFLNGISGIDAIESRDRSLFELMYSSGLRVSEVLKLELKDINFTERQLLIRLGKGGKDRYVPFSRTALKYLVTYVNQWRKQTVCVRGCGHENSVYLNGDRSLGYKALKSRFLIYLKRSGLEGKGLSFHSVRHSTATHLLENGASVRYVQDLLGHENIGTTQRYAVPMFDSIKKMYKMYHPRENDYYEEVDDHYLSELKTLKSRLLKEKEKYVRKKSRQDLKLKPIQ